MLSIMKARRGEQTLILFRNGNVYEAYYADAEKLADLSGAKSTIVDEVPTFYVALEDISALMDRLSKADVAVCISEMQDSDGNFVPTINYEEE